MFATQRVGLTVCDAHAKDAAFAEAIELFRLLPSVKPDNEKRILNYLASEAPPAIIGWILLHGEEANHRHALAILKLTQFGPPRLTEDVPLNTFQMVRRDTPDLVPGLCRMVKSLDSVVASEALWYLRGYVKDETAAATIREAMSDRRPEVHKVAVRLLPELPVKIPAQAPTPQKKSKANRPSAKPVTNDLTAPVHPTDINPDWWRERGQ